MIEKGFVWEEKYQENKIRLRNILCYYLMESENLELRSKSAIYLAQMADKATIGRLTKALENDDSMEVRAFALQGLAFIGNEASIEPLINPRWQRLSTSDRAISTSL